jgi:hypothetical protein
VRWSSSRAASQAAAAAAALSPAARAGESFTATEPSEIRAPEPGRVSDSHSSPRWRTPAGKPRPGRPRRPARARTPVARAQPHPRPAGGISGMSGGGCRAREHQRRRHHGPLPRRDRDCARRDRAGHRPGRRAALPPGRPLVRDEVGAPAGRLSTSSRHWHHGDRATSRNQLHLAPRSCRGAPGGGPCSDRCGGGRCRSESGRGRPLGISRNLPREHAASTRPPAVARLE